MEARVVDKKSHFSNFRLFYRAGDRQSLMAHVSQSGQLLRKYRWMWLRGGGVILKSTGIFYLYFHLISGALSEGLWRYLRMNRSYGDGRGCLLCACSLDHDDGVFIIGPPFVSGWAAQ
jgi:hypothetical protein